jgi:hypothetical protein
VLQGDINLPTLNTTLPGCLAAVARTHYAVSRRDASQAGTAEGEALLVWAAPYARAGVG